MEDNLIEQAKKRLKAKAKNPSKEPEIYYGNLPPKKLEEERVYQVRSPASVTGVRG
jgi:hypothetical protein